MTEGLETLREQEKWTAVFERDIALAQEVQQYLYPRTQPELSGASVWGITTPARVVSGDLYDFLPFSDGKVGLLCADVSGKGCVRRANDVPSPGAGPRSFTICR
ncbi:MAG TPA: hypothetical protein VHZ55_33860 [Bryobacteraceae bacterium]|jgi:serine phosphatase RsbU (regulator of sigma subunit)|nr:hypothetical protein [Bryobacteraceae bacterium]